MTTRFASSRLWTIGKRSAQVAGLTVPTAGLGYGTYLYETDPGFHRMVQAYTTMVPVVLHYRLAEFRHHHLSPLTQADWEALDELYAVPTVRQLGRLQGMYTKYAQTCAGLTNTFGDAWIREFRQLENNVPPRSADVVYQTIREETGHDDITAIFSEFDPEPLGSASIGQVHRARLARDGRLVAVKVQYPEAQELFHDDILTIRRFCELFAPEHVVILDAMQKSNAAELDYRNEAQNLRDIRQHMIKHKYQPSQVVVPAPLPELTTKRLLVMELVPGPKLIDGIRAYFQEWAVAHGTTLHDLEMEARYRIETEGVPAKYNGPSAWQMSLYRQWLHARNAVANAGIAAYNATRYGLSWIVPPRWNLLPPPCAYLHSTLPPNIPRIIDTLMRVHGTQLLSEGVFQSDPHGGNFLLLPDGHRLGLIDYGATKRLTRNERLSVCLLFAALHRQDQERLFQMCQLGGYKSKYGRKDVLMKLLQFGYDSYGRDVTGGKNIQQFLDELKHNDPWEEVPDNFVMAQFMSIRLRSLALGMNHPVRCSDWWGPMAEEVLRQEGLPYESWTLEQMEKYKPELNMQRYKFA